MLQYGAARFCTSEAALKVPDIIAKSKREFENTSIQAQVGCQRFPYPLQYTNIRGSSRIQLVPLVFLASLWSEVLELSWPPVPPQGLVFELIQSKIDELLGGMTFIDWEASSIATQPRSYADDVISYLQVGAPT